MGTRERRGKAAYDAYVENSKGVSLISGDTLPEWSALKQEIRDSWMAAADAVEHLIYDENPINPALDLTDI